MDKDKEIASLKKDLETQSWALGKTNDAIKLLYKELEHKNVKLEETNKIKSEFVSIVSHEFRTPLACIKESLSIVLDKTLGEINDEQKDFLKTAKDNVDRLARLINDVLDFQKISAGKMEYFIINNNIYDTIEQACTTMKPLAKQKGILLEVDSKTALEEIPFDSDKILQVLINLINNALKFTEQGSIAISVEDRESDICVAVKDTGIGIAEEDLGLLFESFSQVGKGKRTKGTGLGLNISQKIIEEHKGKIWVESTLGQGTIFYFSLLKK
jgi:signal transduction histidine kinase